MKKKINEIKKSLKQIIDSGELEFSIKNNEPAVGYLWEHTVHVASIAKKLAKSEGLGSFLPELTALFHDSGKFVNGDYHIDDTPEEEIASRIAEEVLSKYGLEINDINKVKNALLSLYDENTNSNEITDIIHDADFLSKFGSVGVAVFFTKMVLRGKNINEAVLRSLSKELTYASVLPLNMRTKSGRKIAEIKKKKTIDFFTELLEELREDGFGDFIVKKKIWLYKEKDNKAVEIFLVTKRQCKNCNSTYSSEFFVEKGIKCQKLNLIVKCKHCDDNYKLSFCLPEII